MDQRRDDAGTDRVASARLRRDGRASRPALAVVIVVAWIGGLALLGRRELLKPLSTKLAEAALHVQPASHYYVIERGGRVIGGASAEIDTTRTGLVARQHLFGALVEGDTGEVIVRARSTYTPRLAFRSLNIELERGDDSLALTLTRTSDSTAVLSLQGGGDRAETRRLAAPEPLFPPPLAAIPLVLVEGTERGSSAVVRVFDPVVRRVRDVDLRLAAESLFVVADSAMFDPRRGRWAMARRDTVRAWLVISDSTPARAWVDRAGQIVDLDDGRGTRVRRTAYEIAYENYRIERGIRGPSARRRITP